MISKSVKLWQMIWRRMFLYRDAQEVNGDGMKLLVGLGNPGLTYEWTRHNAGFKVLEEFEKLHALNFSFKANFKAEMAEFILSPGEKVLLARPQTFMNDSGISVRNILQWYKLKTQNMLVVHDDVSLPLGKLRFQSGGGAGGQHGVESIIHELSDNKDFHRLKIGVGPDPGGSRRASFVLSKFSQEDRLIYEKVLALALEAVQCWLKNGSPETMNKYNGLDLAKPDDAKT